MGLRDTLLDFFFPPKCPFCGAVLAGDGDLICPRCRKNLPWTPDRPGKATFVKTVTAPLYYEGDVRRSMLDFKFNAIPARGRAFGRLAGEAVKRQGSEFDVLTWVPLSRKRLRKRGYDQAELIARGAGEILGTQPVSLLRKARDVPPQSRIRSPEARRANISGCYEVPEPSLVQGRRILIIDDIITTGSTVSECARMLMLAGARQVSAASVACHRDS